MTVNCIKMELRPATLTDVELWNYYALAYDSTVTQTSFYKELQNKVLSHLKFCTKVLDVGCGTGNYTEFLAQQGKTVFAIDSSDRMIAYTKQKITGLASIITKESSENFNFWSLDFDGALCVNALYAFEKPLESLANIYRHLVKDGVLVLSGPKPGGSGEVLVEACREELKQRENADELLSYMDIVSECNLRIGGFMRTFSSDRLSDLLREIGFSEIIHADDHSYLDQNHFVVARK